MRLWVGAKRREADRAELKSQNELDTLPKQTDTELFCTIQRECVRERERGEGLSERKGVHPIQLFLPASLPQPHPPPPTLKAIRPKSSESIASARERVFEKYEGLQQVDGRRRGR